jgi:5-methylthioadenosine/S-adenosylhomocysteine deaminase
MTRASVDPHASYTVDPEYMGELKQMTRELNDKYGSKAAPIIWHTHIGETEDELQKTQETFKLPTRSIRNGLMRYLDSLGILDEHVIAAHCVAVENRDIEVIRKRKVKVSHNAVSNLKLASGVSPVPEMLQRGITVSLGTDSPCSNNTADMFDLMKTTALLHKGVNRDPTLMPAQKVLEMATIDGARALSWEKEIGSIEVGKKADLIIVDFGKPHLCPLYSEISHLVYAAKPSDVETVMINGEVVLEKGRLTRLNIEEVMETAEEAKQTLLGKLA